MSMCSLTDFIEESPWSGSDVGSHHNRLGPGGLSGGYSVRGEDFYGQKRGLLWPPAGTGNGQNRGLPSGHGHYQSLFVQGRGALRKELHTCLRTGRAMRRAKAYTKGGVGQGQLSNMVMISERPAEVADRAVPGHWEGDLIFGRKMTAIGTLVERHSRYVILLKLPNGHGAEAVRKAMTKRILTLPAQLRRSITWDQGKEMAEHVQFTVDTGVQIYFCDPKSPWQRGSNENTNGLLRQYLPKSSDLSQGTQRELDAIARSLNTRPRQTLGWMTPSKAFADAVALTG